MARRQYLPVKICSCGEPCPNKLATRCNRCSSEYLYKRRAGGRPRIYEYSPRKRIAPKP